MHQGCPLSCHNFNLVRQVLIYSLRDCAYFEWWYFYSDPCSLYADDMAIFLPDIDQLAKVLKHIQWVGTFTGLELNLVKTIAFNLQVKGTVLHGGIIVCCAQVKYLGAFLGLGDLSKLNFEQPLHKAKSIISRWTSRNLSLDVRILVSKIFVFSVFTHVLNVVYITNAQIDLIQKLLNEFLWRGQNKIRPTVMYSSYHLGGMNMLWVRDVIHNLKVK